MSILFTDEVEITNITRNINYRTENEGTPFNSPAFVEEESEIRRANDGSPINPETIIILPKNTVISNGDYIKITKLKGVVLYNVTKPVGLWRLDEIKGTISIDESGYNNHGSLDGTFTDSDWVAGKVNNALNFDGVDQRLNVGNSVPLNRVGTSNFWFSLWMKSKDTVPLNFGALVDKWEDTYNFIYLTSYGMEKKLAFRMKKGIDSGHIAFSSASDVFDTEWHHIVISVNRTTNLAYLYVDSVVDGITIDLSALPVACYNAGDLTFGARNDGIIPYEGRLDEIRYYEGIPTTEDIENLYNDSSGYSSAQEAARKKVKRTFRVGTRKESHVEVLI